MNRAALLLASALLCEYTFAGPIADEFGSGVLGMAWDASLDSVVGVFPDGEHVYATTPGQRAYLVRDDQEFMGVIRTGHSLLYGFGSTNNLVAVVFSFPYERKEELMGALLSNFGRPRETNSNGQQQSAAWQDRGISIVLRTSLEPKHGIAWLGILGPKYQTDKSSKGM